MLRIDHYHWDTKESLQSDVYDDAVLMIADRFER
jgi:hypothetical protein